MKALIITDMQNVILNHKNFDDEKIKIEKLISVFRENNEPIIFTKHVEDDSEGFFYKESEGAQIPSYLVKDNDYVIEKTTPSMFRGTNAQELLEKLNVDHLIIAGFNTEYCCLFSSIAAFDKGYKVTFVEDATGTTNDETTYEMPGLDIKDFIGTVLDWSGAIEVLYCEEYLDKYNNL
ncbi:isochorismatase family protein [Oceanirhabdus seepicola]|uniref:Isochorismatase family protein n=1 Tax=Oceanirhabdus seepicola TaxID=2828781 RepID=A0A9J6PA70_9CLOT|nr:isochorismatase family protein [Oceanirhabdus seepicola]MCM1992285.1 isochorismatase family protein [Oceanirhabdus seepicola]